MAKYKDTYEFHLAKAKRLARLINETLITPHEPNALRDLSIQFEIHFKWLRHNTPNFRATQYKAFLLSPQGLSKFLFDMPKWRHVEHHY